MFRINSLIPVLGIALVGGGYFMMKSYLGFQEQIRAVEESMATLDRIRQDYDLSGVMMRAQGSGCAVTARSLDELLAANLAAENAQLESAEPGTRAMVEYVIKVVERRRSESIPTAGAVPAGGSDREGAGQKTATPTLASASPGE